MLDIYYNILKEIKRSKYIYIIADILLYIVCGEIVPNSFVDPFPFPFFDSSKDGLIAAFEYVS
jgi:hypothetical protein